MTPQRDEELHAKVLQLKQNGGSAPLASLTTFEWDTVYCYLEGATADEVNREVGQTVLKDRFTSAGTLAIFIKDGKVVKALLLPELSFTPGRQPTGVVVDGNKLRAP